MLGRQQIAGIPTAISELFKNAHDAYADHAIVDYFRSDSLFVLRDDGIGMTEDDFELRWLTLGTESKAGLGGLAPPPARPGYPPRAVLGEKGIGRLAIAAIGPQMLLLSRSVREGELGDLLVSYVHWGMFELPGANVDEIEIPTVSLPGGSLPTASDVGTLVDWVEDNLKQLATPDDRALAVRIRKDLKAFRAVAPDELAPVLGAPGLLSGPGTHFYILPAADLLISELDDRPEEATPLRKMLVGFANTMTPGHAQPMLDTSFRDHYTEDAWEDVIAESEFFTPKEFQAADHHITGEFDAYGQFSGSVSVYGSEPKAYQVAWSPARGRKPTCGPFRFSLAYVQGTQKDSRLDPEMFGEVSSKLARYGGLYIYRDGIRVLPYGSSDFDFLDIEVRRAKSASDAFFSYRRMMGAIELTRQSNGALREKAGREGFADNLAYREFRQILMAFLWQVAIDFFRKSGVRSEEFVTRRGELNRLDKARQRRSRQTRTARRQLSVGLDKFFERVETAEPARAVAAAIARLNGRIASAVAHADDTARAAAEVVDAETEARLTLREVVASLELKRPRGVGLTQTQTRSWLAYENEKARLQHDLIDPALREVEERVAEATRTHGVAVDRRLRFDHAIGAAVDRGREQVRSGRRSLDDVSKHVRTESERVGREYVGAIEELAQDILARAARLDLGTLDDHGFVTSRSAFEFELLEEAATHERILASIAAQLSAVAFPNGSGEPDVTYMDEVEALETDLEALRERAEEDLALVQLGMAIEVINHEFEGSVTAMRRSLKRIKNWADANPALREPYADLRASFEHLDGYLRLFTPFHRRLYRSPIEITGAEIEAFLRKVFERKLDATGVEMVVTPVFRKHKVTQYPSTLYPVFVNLVDNATYWLTDYRGDRRITLDVKEQGLVVRDSGPGVAARDRAAIFDFGFSRKLAGSGYGLYISRQILRRDGWDIDLSPTSPDAGAEFVISERPAPRTKR
jgi:signal transduction histidine kinase